MGHVVFLRAVNVGGNNVALVRSGPFAGVGFSKDLRGWVAVLGGGPSLLPTCRCSRRRGTAGASASTASMGASQ
jgi:hypothetical protein